jgi:hypothetical protein
MEVVVRRHLVTAAVAVGLNLARLTPGLAAEFDDKTPCTKLFTALDNRDADKFRAGYHFVADTMDAMDSAHTEKGEPGIMAGFSDEGLLHAVTMVVEHCRSHPRMTVYNSAAFVYRGLRDLETQLGVAK